MALFTKNTARTQKKFSVAMFIKIRYTKLLKWVRNGLEMVNSGLKMLFFVFQVFNV